MDAQQVFGRQRLVHGVVGEQALEELLGWLLGVIGNLLKGLVGGGKEGQGGVAGVEGSNDIVVLFDQRKELGGVLALAEQLVHSQVMAMRLMMGVLVMGRLIRLRVAEIEVLGLDHAHGVKRLQREVIEEILDVTFGSLHALGDQLRSRLELVQCMVPVLRGRRLERAERVVGLQLSQHLLVREYEAGSSGGKRQCVGRDEPHDCSLDCSQRNKS